MSWLDELKEGDTVIVADNYKEKLAKVENTKRYITVNDRKFNKKTGNQVGNHNAWIHYYLVEPTLTAVAKVKESELRSKLKEQVTELWNKKLNKLASY